MKSQNGLRLAALYSIGCPELRQLRTEPLILGALTAGPDSFPHNADFVETAMRLLDPFVFYQLIALKHGRTDFFSEDIVRTHWFGGDLLRPVTVDDIRLLLARGTIPTVIHRAEEIILRLTDLLGGLPHHNFVVLSLLKRMRRDIKAPVELLAGISQCLVGAGKVVEVRDGLRIPGAGKLFPQAGIGLIKIDNPFKINVRVGDYVSHHLSWAREKISEKEAKGLDAITRQALDFIKWGQ